MNWRKILLISVFSVSTFSFAQSNLLNAKTPAEIGKKTEAELKADNDKPLPYGYVGDRDVLMAKMVWEVIDVNQRINFPLYYPVDDSKDLGPDRRSLFKVLMDGVKDQKITEVYDDGYFQTKKSFEDIEKALVFLDTTDLGIEEMNSDPEAYKPRTVTKKVNGKMVQEIIPASKQITPEYITKYTIEPYHVEEYKTKGYWYFDKRQGELKYRLQAICPRVPDVYTLKNADKNGKKELVDLFWIYFPSAREVLHAAKAFNERNSAMPFSFDHVLNSRRFSANIFLEENVYGDREIAEYMKDNAQMQLLESERVKEKIRNFELDMWNY